MRKRWLVYERDATSAINSISTHAPSGNCATPKAPRACLPASPNTSTSSSEAPFVTRCASVKPGVALTRLDNFTMRLTRFRSPVCACRVASRSIATARPVSVVMSAPSLPARSRPSFCDMAGQIHKRAALSAHQISAHRRRRGGQFNIEALQGGVIDMEVSSFDLEHFSVSLHKKQARRQYGDRCGRSRSPSRSDGGDPAASSFGEPPDAISQKIQAHVFCTQKRLILLDETRIGAHQNRLKIFNRKRIELDP